MKGVEEERIGDLRICIDRSLCIGTGNCVNLAPEVFELDENALANFVEPLEGIERSRLIEACEICPVDALSVFDEEDEQLVP